MENLSIALDLLNEVQILLAPCIWIYSIFVGAVSFVLGMYFMLSIEALCIKFNKWKEARKELKNKEKEV